MVPAMTSARCGGVSSKCCCSPDSPAALGRSVIVCTRGMLGTKIRQMGHSGLLPLRRTDCSEPVKTPLNFDEKWIKKKIFLFPVPDLLSSPCIIYAAYSADTGVLSDCPLRLLTQPKCPEAEGEKRKGEHHVY